MTLEKATLPVPQFDQITLAELKQKIESCIAEGQKFLNELTETPDRRLNCILRHKEAATHSKHHVGHHTGHPTDEPLHVHNRGWHY